MCKNGIGAKVDYEKAKQYYEKAVELENVDALYGLGKLYLKQDCVYHDYNNAIAYLTLAVEQGHE